MGSPGFVNVQKLAVLVAINKEHGFSPVLTGGSGSAVVTGMFAIQLRENYVKY